MRKRSLHYWWYEWPYFVVKYARGDNMTAFKRINHDAKIMGGKPCITGTRITVGTILMQMSEGVTIPTLLAEYPELTEADINEAFQYAAWTMGTKEAWIESA